jgi:hypothetical protein
MSEERRYFPNIFEEAFSPDDEIELDETWRQMAADLLTEKPDQRYSYTPRPIFYGPQNNKTSEKKRRHVVFI